MGAWRLIRRRLDLYARHRFDVWGRRAAQRSNYCAYFFFSSCKRMVRCNKTGHLEWRRRAAQGISSLTWNAFGNFTKYHHRSCVSRVENTSWNFKVIFWKRNKCVSSYLAFDVYIMERSATWLAPNNFRCFIKHTAFVIWKIENSGRTTAAAKQVVFTVCGMVA